MSRRYRKCGTVITGPAGHSMLLLLIINYTVSLVTEFIAESKVSVVFTAEKEELFEHHDQNGYDLKHDQ